MHRQTSLGGRNFLPMWNGTAQLVDQQPKDAADMELYKDASGMLGCGGYFQGEQFLSACASLYKDTSGTLGCGGYFQGEWFHNN